MYVDCNLKDIVYVTNEEVIADKCEVIHTYLQYPKKIMVRSLITNQVYFAYPEYHCYNNEEDAKKAAEKYKEGYKDIIY